MGVFDSMLVGVYSRGGIECVELVRLAWPVYLKCKGPGAAMWAPSPGWGEA